MINQSSGRDEASIVEVVEQLLLRKPFFDYRRIAAQAVREGGTVNTKVVRHTLKELGVRREVGPVRIRTTDSSHPH